MNPTPLPVPGRNQDRDHVVVPLARAPFPDGPRQTETSGLTRRSFDRRWLAVSAFGHLLVLGLLIFGLVEAPRPPQPPVLTITLVPHAPGSAGAAGGGNGQAADRPQPAAVAAAPAEPEITAPEPEATAAPTPPPELPPPEPPPTPQPTPPKATLSPPPIPVAPPPPAPVAQPLPQPPPPPKPPKPIVAPPAVAMEIPPPKPRHVPPRRQVARHAPPTPTPPPAPAPMPAAPPAAATPSAAVALAAPGAGPATDAGRGTEGAGKGAIGTTAGPGDDYLERLYRHLLRYKKYPPEAIGAKQQGSVVIGFTIARDGAVSDARIEKSSGSAILDQATLAMVRRASPAPPLPDGFKGNSARVKFPIDYKLSLIDQMF